MYKSISSPSPLAFSFLTAEIFTWVAVVRVAKFESSTAYPEIGIVSGRPSISYNNPYFVAPNLKSHKHKIDDENALFNVYIPKSIE